MEQKLIEGLKKQIEKIDNLEKEGYNSINFNAWETSTKRLLERISGNESSYVKNFSSISFSVGVYYHGQPEYEYDDAYNKGLNNAREILKTIVEELEEYGLPEGIKNDGKTNKNNTEVTVNLNQTLNINVKNVLENNLTVSQYNELKEILSIKEKEKKESKLNTFLMGIGINGVSEILKSILLS